MYFVISCIEEFPLGHIHPHVAKDFSRINLTDWKEIIAIMKRAYADLDPKGTARRALIDLYQQNRKFEDFWSEFYQLAQMAEMSTASTLEYLRDCLSSEIRDQLIGISTKAMGLDAFVATCQEIATNLEIYNK